MHRSVRNDALRLRIEQGIWLAAPLLDLVLAVGDRVSRAVGAPDPDPIAHAENQDPIAHAENQDPIAHAEDPDLIAPGSH
jgi:hypothetical protein